MQHLQQQQFFSVIKYPNNFAEDTLWGMLNQRDLDEKKYANEWCKFLNFHPDEVNLNLYIYKDKYQDSPHYWDGVFASYYFDSLLAQNQLLERGSNDVRDEFLSIQTMRTIFNDRLAGFIGIPYYSSSLKSCIHSKILENKMERRMMIDQLIYEIGPKNDNLDSNSPYITEYSAPFLLGLILERMKNPDDYWDLLKEYKEKFSPLRKKIVQDKNQWDGRSGHYLSNYLKYINDFTNDVDTSTQKNLVKGGAIVGTVLTAITPYDKVLLDLGMKLLDLIVHNKSIRKMYLRKFQPEVYLLISLSEEAKQLHSVENRIQNIWGDSWSRREHDQLLNLTKTTPYYFSKLKNLS